MPPYLSPMLPPSIARAAYAQATDKRSWQLAVAEAYVHAGRWDGSLCDRGGALARIGRQVAGLQQATDGVAVEQSREKCWAVLTRAWGVSWEQLANAWTLGPLGGGTPQPVALEKAAALCRSVAGDDGWELWPVLLDLPRYVSDLRSCGRDRADLWDALADLEGRLVQAGALLSARREAHLCVPAKSCGIADVLAVPIPLWLSHSFYLQNALWVLPVPLLSHANVTMRLLDARRVSRHRAMGDWVVVGAQRGRLGNTLVDLANGLAIALKGGFRGVTLGRWALAEGSNTTGVASLFGDLVGAAVDVPSSLLSDRVLRRSLPRVADGGRWAHCVDMDHRFSMVTVQTHWSTAGGDLHSVFPSCALPLLVRQRLLRTSLLPRLQRRGSCTPAAAATDALLIHLRGGDAVPAVTPDHAQPPCATYDHAIEAEDVLQVHIVAEDARNPCLAHIVSRYGERVSRVHVGRSLAEDVCTMLSATVIFLSASSLSSNLVLLGEAKRVYTPLPPADFPPALPYLGFTSEQYLLQLCDVFKGNVVGYLPESEYYTGEAPQGNAARSGRLFFGGVSAARTGAYPLARVAVRRCV